MLSRSRSVVVINGKRLGRNYLQEGHTAGWPMVTFALSGAGDNLVDSSAAANAASIQ